MFQTTNQLGSHQIHGPGAMTALLKAHAMAQQFSQGDVRVAAGETQAVTSGENGGVLSSNHEGLSIQHQGQ
jgi:hypothetical protein